MTSWKTTIPLTICLTLTLAACTRDSESEPQAQPQAAVEEQKAAAPPPAEAPQAEAEAAAEAAPAAVDARGDWIIWADGEPWDGPAPLTVEFECDLMEEVPNPKYEWDFGDGSPKSNEPNPKHTYEKVGQYTAVCRVTDPSGGAGEDSVVIDVDPVE